MPPLYVIDAHALMTLPALCSSEERIYPFFDRLTDQMSAGNLTFPNQVLQDCKKFTEGEFLYTWIKAASAHRKHYRVDNGWQEEVLGACEDLADFDDDCEQTQVIVASLALMICETGRECVVVTEDRLELPNRRCLSDACITLGLESMGATEMLEAMGMSDFL
ncbi:DUF4411 family protein [Streptomyces sp. NPDC127092]|uniref:DUF4411 family protein n=1 Tax=Streptomyces sp. NPDC127092 TaxID=3347135 RepID=UPI00364BFFC9